MSVRSIAIQSPGDMGHGVGRELKSRGLRVITCLRGRSRRTHGLAEAAAMEVVPDLETLVEEADLVLSILPPSAALAQAETLAQACRRTGASPVVADCNAVSPATVRAVQACFADSAVCFADVGIIGIAPGRGPLPTRFYASGPDLGALQALHGGGIRVCPLGEEVGQASAMKMVYASVTKGTMTLHALALTAAQTYGLSESYLAELSESQPAVLAAMRRSVPRLPLDAGRWIGEMHEIAAAFDALGLPGAFHEGAARMFEILERTPIAEETRETVDTTRTLEEAVAMYATALSACKLTNAR